MVSDERRPGLTAVVYVGNLDRVEAFFDVLNKRFTFQRGVPRFFEPEEAKLFTPSRYWLIGDVDPSILDSLASRKHVIIRRAVALGDVVAVHGAAQAIIKACPEYAISIQVDRRYVDLFSRHPTYFRVFGTDESVTFVPIDRILSLDNIFELDHIPGNEKVSRVTKTWQYFFRGEPERYQNFKPDFSLVIPEEERAAALSALVRKGIDPETRKGRPLIATATRAIQSQRVLGPGLVENWTRYLTEHLDCDVLLIENDSAHVWSGPRIHSFPGSSIPHALALIEQCDVLCSMDSGAMWLGHCAGIPQVVWFGPTPPDTKINWHPLWPDGVRALEMNTWINCPACYEDAQACGWKFSCNRPPQDEFNRKTTQAVVELLERRYGKVTLKETVG